MKKPFKRVFKNTLKQYYLRCKYYNILFGNYVHNKAVCMLNNAKTI